MPVLDKLQRAEFVRQGSGSLVVDGLKSLASHAVGAGAKLLGGRYRMAQRASSDALNKGLWHGYGKHVDRADKALGHHLSKIPVLGRVFKTKDKYEHALTPEIRKKIRQQIPLTKEEQSIHHAATEGVSTHRATAPIKAVGKVAVPIAASMYVGEKMMKHKDQNKTAEAGIVVQKSVLLKTAGVLRNLDQEKKAALAELAETTKLATAQKAVLSLVKEGLIDLDQIDEKIAELTEHPERAESFFAVPKVNSFGTLTKSQTSSSNPLEDFLLNGDK
jgi:hypothetical protein